MGRLGQSLSLMQNSTQKSYYEVCLRQVPWDLEDILSEFCFSFGAQGISEELKFLQPDLTFDPEIVVTPFKSLIVYFEEIPPQDFVSELKLRWPKIETEVKEEGWKDWLLEWKKGFHAFQLVENFWIVPSWEKDPEGVTPIRIDPGLAFGTGTHATTQLASRMVVSSLRQNKFTSVLDVGTGTGVLAILAEKMNANHVVGLEIDPMARQTARENIELNQCQKIKIPDTDLNKMGEKFELVIANIIDGVLIQLKPDLLNCLTLNGHLILSGILREREQLFWDKFAITQDFEIIDQQNQDEWTAFHLKRK